jgi:tRNA A37 threonylcarbamoyladenosine modification protein TsaB
VEIGNAMARRGEFFDAQALAPVYVRKPEAEEKWEVQHRAK